MNALSNSFEIIDSQQSESLISTTEAVAEAQRQVTSRLMIVKGNQTLIVSQFDFEIMFLYVDITLALICHD